MMFAGLGLSKLLGGGSKPKRPKTSSMPKRPEILDKNFFVKDQFKIANQTTPQEGMSANILDRLYDRATSQGPTQNAKYLMEQNRAAQNKALGNQLRGNNSQFSSLMNSAAMRGGLDRGNRWRALTRLNNANMNTRFNNQANRAANDLNILQKDEAGKLALQSQLPGQLMNHANFNLGKSKFDIMNSLSTANNFYNQDMQNWAARNASKQQEYAAKNSGGLFGGGGFLGLGI